MLTDRQRSLLIYAVIISLLGHAMAQARYHFQDNRCAICGCQSGSRQAILRILRLSLVSIIPPVLHSYIASIYHQRNIISVLESVVK
jgi:hypothetical protein